MGFIGVAKSEWDKLPNFMSYNPFLQSNEITPNADPSPLMFPLLHLSPPETHILPGWDSHNYKFLNCLNCHALIAATFGMACCHED